MITIFTIPKAFTDTHIRTIQHNAILSWKKLDPNIEIILMGNDAGVEETAREFSIKHIKDVEVNEYGTPLLNSAFLIASKEAKYSIIVYVNCDIILLSDFIKSIQYLPKESSMTVGRRTDFDVDYEIDFSNPSWENILLDKVESNGKLHSYAGIDYFIFNNSILKNLPPFAVGRVGWDNWVIRESRKIHKYTIDATENIKAIHQNHSYSGNNLGSQRKTNPEALKNNSFTENKADAFTIEDANWKLLNFKLKRNILFPIPFIKRYIKSLLNI